jgi:inositol polyphosphate 1-phosphatase
LSADAQKLLIIVMTRATVSSLPALVRACVVGAVAAQHFVRATFPHPDDGAPGGGDRKQALAAQDKGALDHKSGVQDLVTAADLAVQEIVLAVLSDAARRATFLAGGAVGCAAPSNLTLVGEEAESAEYDAMAPAERAAVHAARYAQYGEFIASAESSAVLAWADGIAAKFAATGTTGGAAGGEDEYAVFVDPIDATAAFVDGDTDAPMTLIGISRNGRPVGGVVNRLFQQAVNPSTSGSFSADDAAAAAAAAAPAMASTLSFCCEAGPCVVWGHPMREPPAASPTIDASAAAAADEAPVRRAPFSAAPTAVGQQRVLAAIAPITRCPARGGGHKVMMVVAARLADCTDGAFTQLPAADVFASSPWGLKKWDLCAPHAFLAWLGGHVLRVRGGTYHHIKAGDGADADAGGDLDVAEITYGEVTVAGAAPVDSIILVSATQQAMDIAVARLRRHI